MEADERAVTVDPRTPGPTGRRVVAAAVVAALATSVAAAAGVALSGPQVVKLDWDTRALTLADVDADGRPEILVINNDRARIDVLAAGAWSEDGAGGRGIRTVTTAAKAYDLAVGDVDGDGRSDLVYTADPGGLVARLQGEDGSFGKAIRTDRVDPVAWTGSLALLRSVSGDRRTVAVVSKRGLSLYRLEDGRWTESSRSPLEDGDPFGLRPVDLDGDGREDLMYRMTGSDRPLRLRLRRADGALGPERGVELPDVLGSVEPFVDGAARDLAPRVVWVESASHALRAARLVLRPGDGDPVRERYRAPVREAEGDAWARGDLDGDGAPEWYLADPDGARVWRFAPLPDGALDAPTSYPAYAGVRMLAVGDVDGDGRDDLAMGSRKDRAVGVARWREGRLGYPEPVRGDVRPEAIGVGDWDGDGRDDLAYVVDAEDGRELVPMFSSAAGWTEGSPAVLDGLGTTADGLVVRDLDGDGRPEAIVFAPRQPIRLVEFRAAGASEIPEPEAGDQRGLVDGLRPHGLTFADLDGDGEDDWLAAGDGRVRVLSWSRERGFAVRDQVNAGDPEPVLASFVVAASTPEDRGPAGRELWMLVGDDGTWERHAPGDDGVWRLAERHAGSGLEPRTVVAAPDGAWVAGRRSLERIRIGGARWVAEPVGGHEIDLEDFTPVGVAVGDADGDGGDEAALVDAASTRILQIVARVPGGFEPRLRFRVFEEDPHYTGKRGSNREPRDAGWADLDGDGREDLVVLVHDRVLVYPSGTPSGAPAP